MSPDRAQHLKYQLCPTLQHVILVHLVTCLHLSQVYNFSAGEYLLPEAGARYLSVFPEVRAPQLTLLWC